MKIHPVSRPELWLAQGALVFAILLQAVAWRFSPVTSYDPHGIIIITEVALLALISLSASTRHTNSTSFYRLMAFMLLGMITLANIESFMLVVRLLITESETLSGRELIVSAIAIFLTNIIVFALWYWEIDSPGLSGHKWSKNDRNFQFTQQNLDKDFPDWQPSFIDYLYLSVTNAVNFAPGDAQPLTSEVKLLMGSQALISVFTLALILARSVSILN